ncbi:MAG: glycoside hydrolase family 130 protein [Phycisphaerae bacterium]|nr:glycoside hydrolase family 130 protein [Phycisphaerae bacterium]
MNGNTGRDIVHRWEGNPLISIADLSFRCSDIRNAGIAQYNGEMVMLITIESLQGFTLVHKASSRDGINFSVEHKPFMSPPQTGPRAKYENYGIRDVRITPMDGKYYITYIADSDLGMRLGLACTEDFKAVEFIGYVSQPDVKNGVLFPCKIEGRYALLKRPAGGAIWMSFSEDLQFWGDERVVMTPRGGHWDSNRIGAAAVPIEIPQGWLLIYYGAKDTSAGPLVRLGAAVLDKDDPAHVLARSNIPLLSPREKYERIGDVPNMIFSCGACIKDEELFIYYGASDSCICLGTAQVEQIVDFCLACTVVEDYIESIEEEQS